MLKKVVGREVTGKSIRHQVDTVRRKSEEIYLKHSARFLWDDVLREPLMKVVSREVNNQTCKIIETSPSPKAYQLGMSSSDETFQQMRRGMANNGGTQCWFSLG